MAVPVGSKVAVAVGSEAVRTVGSGVAVAVGSEAARTVVVDVRGRTVVEGPSLGVGIVTTAWAAAVGVWRGRAGETGLTKPSPAMTMDAIAGVSCQPAGRTVTVRADTGDPR